MTPPVRLRNDPAFRDGLGCDLSNEARALEGTNLTELRARVEAARPLPTAPPRSRRWPCTFAAAGMLLAGLAGWSLLGQPGPTPSTAEPPLLQEPLAAPRRAEATVAAPVDAPVAHAPQVTPAAPASRSAVPRAPALLTEPLTLQEALPYEAPGNAPPDLQPVAVARGDLAEQSEAFDAAKDLLVDGSAQDGLEAFGTYLARWPSGVFAAEARFGQLRANARLGAWPEVESLARVLGPDPELDDRRDEILSLRAEALVHLSRCEEAKALADDLSRATQTLVRRSCR